MSKFSRPLKHQNAHHKKKRSLRVSFKGFNCAGDHTWSSIWIQIHNFSSLGMKRPKRPTESKPGKVFQTSSSPTDLTRTGLSYTYRTALGGVGSTSQFESAGWWQKLTHRSKFKQCTQCGVVKEFGKDFHKMQLGRGCESLACKGGSRTTNQNHSSHWSAWFSPMQTRGILED